MHNFLLYAANLHVGGAVQVAVSVIDEIARSPSDAEQISLLVSTEVNANLMGLGVPLERFRAYRVEDHRGLSAMFRNPKNVVGNANAMLTVFGPFYLPRPRIPNVVGFAQPWIIYPDNEIYREWPVMMKWRTRMKYAIQSLFFRRADLMIVELEHVRRGLVRAGIAEEGRIRVVRNCLASLYGQPERWRAAPAIVGTAPFKLGFVGRNYAHKNTRIFPEVKKMLRRDFGFEVAIYVTFSDAEWAACSADFRAEVVNVGPLSVAQCPSFYQQVDAVLFPSLLECFSATPLEAMAMKRPLFASDRPFNRDVCGDLAFYFDPLDAASAAASIANYLQNTGEYQGRVERAYSHAMASPGPAERARRYLECLREAVAV